MTDTIVSQQEVETMIEKLTGMFDHIRNTFINASQLAEQVNQLSQQVARLQHDVEQTAQANAALNATVQSLTEQRNAVVAERDEWRNKHQQLDYEHEELRHRHEELQHSHESLQHTANSYRDEWNNSQSELQRLKEEHAVLHERLRRTQRYIDNMKATLAGDQTRDVESGQFEELPKVHQAGGSSW